LPIGSGAIGHNTSAIVNRQSTIGNLIHPRAALVPQLTLPPVEISSKKWWPIVASFTVNAGLPEFSLHFNP
jgi:hypothetical protein